MEDLKYQLVLQLPGESHDDLELLQELEDALLEAMEDEPHQVDGHGRRPAISPSGTNSSTRTATGGRSPIS